MELFKSLKALFRNRRLDSYVARDRVDLDEQLRALELSDEEFKHAKQLWIQFARDYDLPPEKLRANDRLTDIVRTDFFGDKGLDFEMLLKKKGIKSFPADDATLEYLIRQLI